MVLVALAEFIGQYSVNWGMLVTGGFIASSPPIVLLLAFYRYIVSELAAGGLKGQVSSAYAPEITELTGNN